jgi:non-specific serine/threonine protein kinase/serine/threonine-protein kinase
MNPERYRRLHEVFDGAAGLDEPALQGYLDAACGGDATLRAEAESLLRRDRELASRSEGASAAGRPAPPRIPGLRPLGLLGLGGFGEVWLAERVEPIVQWVAIKVLRPGLDSRELVARFEQERQALAVMSHPNIAKVFDAGVTEDDRPYLMMEYVAGEPITEYCNRHRLTLRQRLELLLPVCQAVQHAHTKGVIHRDLKPGNVLVEPPPGGEGVPSSLRGLPKVIDFGVAKALEGALTDTTLVTLEGQLIGTPGYMSPEQAGVGATDLDTRTDVYSLGALLYELLTGLLPFDPRGRTFAQFRRLLGEEEPARPSRRLEDGSGALPEAAQARRMRPEALLSVLRRELDCIPVRALRREREDRYRTPAELADDLARYLSGRPLAAGPESAGYRLRKFALRHRVAVLGAAAFLLAVLGGTVASTRYALREANARRESERRERETARIADFQGSLLRGLNAFALGKGLAEDLRAAVRKSAEAAGLSAAEAADREKTFVEALQGADLAGVATQVLDRNILERAVATIDRDFADVPTVRSRLLEKTLELCLELGLTARALDSARAVVDLTRRHLGDHEKSFDALYNLASVHLACGNPREAEPIFRNVLEWRRRNLDPGDLRLLKAEASLGDTIGVDQPDESERLLRRALEGFEKAVGEGDEGTIEVRADLARLLNRQGRYPEAEPHHRAVVKLRRQTGGEDDVRVHVAELELAANLRAQRRTKDVEAVCRRAVEALRRILGNDHPSTLNGVASLADALRALGRRAEAEKSMREAVDGFRRAPRLEDRDRFNELLVRFAIILSEQGKHAEAEAPFREALAAFEARPRGDVFTVAGARLHAGHSLARLGRRAEAEAMLVRGYRELEDWPAPRPEMRKARLGLMKGASQVLAELHDRWHAAEPGAGHDAQAREWRSRLRALSGSGEDEGAR